MDSIPLKTQALREQQNKYVKDVEAAATVICKHDDAIEQVLDALKAYLKDFKRCLGEEVSESEDEGEDEEMDQSESEEEEEEEAESEDEAMDESESD